jgi:hypothetical protein
MYQTGRIISTYQKKRLSEKMHFDGIYLFILFDYCLDLTLLFVLIFVNFCLVVLYF